MPEKLTGKKRVIEHDGNELDIEEGTKRARKCTSSTKSESNLESVGALVLISSFAKLCKDS